MTAAIIGESIGSHQIDRGFEKLVDSYLGDLLPQYSGSLQYITESTDFRDTKHSLTNLEGPGLEFFTIDLSNLPRGVIYPRPSSDGLTFEGGKIKVP